MLQCPALRAFLWAASTGNVRKPFLRRSSCPAVGYTNWQVRLINRMKNTSTKKERERNSAEQGTEAVILESFVKEFNPLILCARLLQQLILPPNTTTEGRDTQDSTRFQLHSDSHLKQFIPVLTFTYTPGTLTQSLICK